eukprot:jgi/Chrpa1/18807/Chrysochromulina_OHIO_Genome00004952-RA
MRAASAKSTAASPASSRCSATAGFLIAASSTTTASSYLAMPSASPLKITLNTFWYTPRKSLLPAVIAVSHALINSCAASSPMSSVRSAIAVAVTFISTTRCARRASTASLESGSRATASSSSCSGPHAASMALVFASGKK